MCMYMYVYTYMYYNNVYIIIVKMLAPLDVIMSSMQYIHCLSSSQDQLIGISKTIETIRIVSE